MDKRTFLRLCISPLAGFLSPLLSRAAAERLKNWAGNVEYSTEKLRNVGTLNQVQDFVKKQSKFKVLGTRHCFNTIADSKDQFLSLQNMDNVVTLDSAARTVTVAGRMTYGKLAPYLDSKGFALANLASLPHISIAGACSTATHGSGEKNGNLSSAVSALEIVSPGGDIITVTRQRDGERFLASVVGLGALGVVTKVTLDVQPTFHMQQYVYENLPLAQLTDHFDEIEAAAYSVSIFTDWQKQRINEVWLKKIFDRENKGDAGEEFFGAKRASRNLHPIAELSAENCTEQMGVPGPWYERLPHFKMGFTPSAGKELQAEYFVPRGNAVDL
jgi:alditol oxidase